MNKSFCDKCGRECEGKYLEIYWDFHLIKTELEKDYQLCSKCYKRLIKLIEENKKGKDVHKTKIL